VQNYFICLFVCLLNLTMEYDHVLGFNHIFLMVILAGVDCQVPFWFPSPHWPELYEFIRGSAALRWHYSRPPGHVSHMRSICTALTEGQPATQNKWLNTCTATAKVVSMFYFYSYFKVKICMFKCKTKVKDIYRLKKKCWRISGYSSTHCVWIQFLSEYI